MKSVTNKRIKDLIESQIKDKEKYDNSYVKYIEDMSDAIIGYIADAYDYKINNDSHHDGLLQEMITDAWADNLI